MRDEPGSVSTFREVVDELVSASGTLAPRRSLFRDVVDRLVSKRDACATAIGTIVKVRCLSLHMAPAITTRFQER